MVAYPQLAGGLSPVVVSLLQVQDAETQIEEISIAINWG